MARLQVIRQPPKWHGSQGDGLTLDLLGGLRRAAHLDHIDFAAKCLLQIEDETAEVKNGPVWLELNEEVDIAIGPCVAAGH